VERDRRVSSAFSDGSQILTNDPKDEEERDKFDGEQDGHRVKCETAVGGVSAGSTWVNQ